MGMSGSCKRLNEGLYIGKEVGLSMRAIFYSSTVHSRFVPIGGRTFWFALLICEPMTAIQH